MVSAYVVVVGGMAVGRSVEGPRGWIPLWGGGRGASDVGKAREALGEESLLVPRWMSSCRSNCLVKEESPSLELVFSRERV